MFGTGIGHYIPLAAYLGFWVMTIASLGGKPLLGLYYMIPFLPYRTMRDHFLDYPLGANVLTILVVAVIIGALIKGKKLPKSPLFGIWAVYGLFLYVSMWMGAAMGNAPAPLWLSDINFVTWKDYMVIPLVFAAAAMVIEDRKAIRTVIILTGISLLFIDRSFILESLSRNWANFDESKRDGGPLAFGSNQTAAFFAQFTMFFWGLMQFVKRKKAKLLGYALVATTVFANMYTFSRGGYLAFLVGVLALGLLKDRKLIIVLAIFLVTWQTVVPGPVQQRINMTKDSSGHLEASAQERVDLWTNAENSFLHSPVIGTGFATFQFGQHVDNLKDTHNWYVKILVETGLVGMIIVLVMLQQVMAGSYRLFKRASDPLYKGLGLGLICCMVSSLVANCFGDRWTYLEISGMLWVLLGAAVRALQLTATATATAEPATAEMQPMNPYLAYR
jgi:putative inorganic carbon (HCO3(-)) transporter